MAHVQQFWVAVATPSALLISMPVYSVAILLLRLAMLFILIASLPVVHQNISVQELSLQAQYSHVMEFMPYPVMHVHSLYGCNSLLFIFIMAK